MRDARHSRVCRMTCVVLEPSSVVSVSVTQQRRPKTIRRQVSWWWGNDDGDIVWCCMYCRLWGHHYRGVDNRLFAVRPAVELQASWQCLGSQAGNTIPTWRVLSARSAMSSACTLWTLTRLPHWRHQLWLPSGCSNLLTVTWLFHNCNRNVRI